MHSLSLVKSISTVGGLTLLSRIGGFIRDLLMAKYLGASMAADAFFIAFKLPNFFRRLFAEGAFSVGFVPLFSRLLGKDVTPESQQAALTFASRVLSWLLPVLLIFLLIMEAAMVPVMLGLTGGFEDDNAKFNFVVELGRYTFPYLLFVSLMSFYSGMLNALEKYTAAAFAPVVMNIIMILALVFFSETDVQGARALAISVSLGGIAQLLLLYISAQKAGLKLALPKPKLSDDVKELLKIMAPAAIGAGVMQINLLVDVLIAARFLPEGSVSWLFYADRLNQLPLGVIGIAAGTVLLPNISRLLSAGEHKAANTQQNKAIEFSLLLTLPAAAALAVIAEPIISTLFERDAFTSADTIATASALAVYALGLPAYVIAKALTPAYFARKDTKTPVKFAIISLIVNMILNIILIQYLAHVGLAAATAIAAWLNVILLYMGLKRSHNFALLTETRIRLLKFVTASLVMAACLYAAIPYFSDTFAAHEFSRILSLTCLVAGGSLVYFILILLMRGVYLGEIRSFLRR